MDNSFKAKDRCKEICRLEQAYDLDEERRDRLVAEIDSAVAAILSQVSRLRLLAPKHVIDTSLALGDANLRFRVAVTDEPNSVVVLDDTLHRARIRDSRDRVIAAAKRFMQIPQ
ncbi:hypothetical protein [Actinoplanes awajinensis]|uniref:hypothetical protein n=1 Tax=Actinoplanes awajinensis TaxID=135946 RepID=UPI0012F7CEB1|nr:hypothetical protein [Actinoplanes awajinensis]